MQNIILKLFNTQVFFVTLKISVMKTVIHLSDVLKFQASVAIIFYLTTKLNLCPHETVFTILEVSEYFDVLICHLTAYRTLRHTEVRYGFLGANPHIDISLAFPFSVVEFASVLKMVTVWLVEHLAKIELMRSISLRSIELKCKP